MDEVAEFYAMIMFTRDMNPTCEKSKQQLCALWTAYCIHYDLVVSSEVYEAVLFHLFLALSPEWRINLCGGNRDAFKKYMAQYL